MYKNVYQYLSQTRTVAKKEYENLKFYRVDDEELSKSSNTNLKKWTQNQRQIERLKNSNIPDKEIVKKLVVFKKKLDKSFKLGKKEKDEFLSQLIALDELILKTANVAALMGQIKDVLNAKNYEEILIVKFLSYLRDERNHNE